MKQFGVGVGLTGLAGVGQHLSERRLRLGSAHPEEQIDGGALRVHALDVVEDVDQRRAVFGVKGEKRGALTEQSAVGLHRALPDDFFEALGQVAEGDVAGFGDQTCLFEVDLRLVRAQHPQLRLRAG